MASLQVATELDIAALHLSGPLLRLTDIIAGLMLDRHFRSIAISVVRDTHDEAAWDAGRAFTASE